MREEGKQADRRRESYAGELFLMAAGALFLPFNVAPTAADRRGFLKRERATAGW